MRHALHTGYLLGATTLGMLCMTAAPALGQSATCTAPADTNRPWLDRTRSAECRADLLIQRLGDADAKLKALASDFADYGVPPARGGDGPVGPTHGGNPVRLASPLAIAATFDPSLAGEAGTLVGREFRAGGMTRMLGPTLDIARTWNYGRTPETFGEDPVLTTRIVTPYVRAIQAEGVVTTLKHFAIYAQEQGRTGDLPIGLRPAVNVVVSEKTMRELYFPPFRSAVVDGGALGIMCSFPRVNGTYACENPYLLGILKNEWGFRGTVSPDFPDAQRSVVEAVNAGLDAGNFGFPRPALPQPPAPAPDAKAAAPQGPPPGMMAAMGLDRVPGGITLQQAVRDGKISSVRLNDLLRRALVAHFALDGIAAVPVDKAEASALAQRIAIEGAVLLRNERGILPLGPDVRSVAIIGAQAGGKAQLQLTGSANITTGPAQSALDAFRAKAGNLQVSYAEGNIGLDALPDVPAELLRTPDGLPGLRAAYAANPNMYFNGALFTTRVEPLAKSTGSMPVPGLPADHQWSVRWSGKFVPRITGLHRFTISGAGSARLKLGGTPVARFDRVDFGDIQHAAVMLTANQPVNLQIEYTPREAAPMPVIPMMGTTLGGHFRLGLAEPDDRIAVAVAAAQKADVAIVFAGNRQGEGADRTSLNLPADQEALIEAVARVNPRTVVVLGTGAQIAMPWRDKVAGILQMWYAGEAFGPAAVALLRGDATPGGRLPITFPATAKQGPGGATANYPGLTNAQGEITDVRYDEGALVGYRWYLSHAVQKPLYPFGYGLSYGDARLSGYAATPAADGAYRVTVRAENRGSRPAVEVVQAYLSLRGVAGQSVPKLAGFTKVTLKPGEVRTVEVAVPATAFDYWDEASHGWQQFQGSFEFHAGRSAAKADFRKRLTR